jgi:hypothetical protein
MNTVGHRYGIIFLKLLVCNIIFGLHGVLVFPGGRPAMEASDGSTAENGPPTLAARGCCGQGRSMALRFAPPSRRDG